MPINSVITMRCLFSEGDRCTLKGRLCLEGICEEFIPGYGVVVSDKEMASILRADPVLWALAHAKVNKGINKAREGTK